MKTKMNNKGFSLVEMLVALAVSSIVVSAIMYFMIQGVTNYKQQTILSNLQNSANLTLNHIVDNVMEAYETETFKVKMGVNETTGNATRFACKPDAAYEFSNGVIFFGEDFDKTDSVLCDKVKDFQIKIVKSSCNMSPSGTSVVGIKKNGLKFFIRLKLEDENLSREVTKLVNVRNQITDIRILGKSVGDADTSIFNIGDIGPYTY